MERVHEAGLDERVEVLLRDYRDLTGTYDKLVSIEMIEAVGWQYFPAFFAKCAELTRPGGAMFLQAIVIQDDLYEAEKAARSFSNKHIFPGGCLPSQAVITRLSAKSGMRTDWTEEISAHYAPRSPPGAIASTTPGRACGHMATTSASRACGTSTSGRRRRALPSAGSATCRSSSRTAGARPGRRARRGRGDTDGRRLEAARVGPTDGRCRARTGDLLDVNQTLFRLS